MIIKKEYSLPEIYGERTIMQMAMIKRKFDTNIPLEIGSIFNEKYLYD